MKICPNCGKVLSYNSYFGAYICSNCKWEDATIGKKRNQGNSLHSVSFKRKTNDKNNLLVLE